MISPPVRAQAKMVEMKMNIEAGLEEIKPACRICEHISVQEMFHVSVVVWYLCRILRARDLWYGTFVGSYVQGIGVLQPTVGSLTNGKSWVVTNCSQPKILDNERSPGSQGMDLRATYGDEDHVV